ncbi:hypothetical protein CPB83DRAFT_854602 [Crepidotus variabilis]|uniref:Uncharacterized protein n=1 Tax=Crepidotus variabilis TaxID=179855 RepID=A0A9P6EF74_9AGAR|nr:hypothetical protein CPB83DRAFT_854602 [Crepidotus variabilis]
MKSLLFHALLTFVTVITSITAVPLPRPPIMPPPKGAATQQNSHRTATIQVVVGDQATRFVKNLNNKLKKEDFAIAKGEIPPRPASDKPFVPSKPINLPKPRPSMQTVNVQVPRFDGKKLGRKLSHLDAVPGDVISP